MCSLTEVICITHEVASQEEWDPYMAARMHPAVPVWMMGNHGSTTQGRRRRMMFCGTFGRTLADNMFTVRCDLSVASFCTSMTFY
jgi:hypothetical protein